MNGRNASFKGNSEQKKKVGREVDECFMLFMDLNHTSTGVFVFILTFQNTATKMYVDVL